MWKNSTIFEVLNHNLNFTIMKELFVMMAVSSNETRLIKELEEAISEWKIYKDDERMKGVVFQAHLLMLRHITQGDMKKAMQVVNDMDSIDKFANSFLNNKN